MSKSSTATKPKPPEFEFRKEYREALAKDTELRRELQKLEDDIIEMEEKLEGRQLPNRAKLERLRKAKELLGQEMVEDDGHQLFEALSDARERLAVLSTAIELNQKNLDAEKEQAARDLADVARPKYLEVLKDVKDAAEKLRDAINAERGLYDELQRRLPRAPLMIPATPLMLGDRGTERLDRWLREIAQQHKL